MDGLSEFWTLKGPYKHGQIQTKVFIISNNVFLLQSFSIDFILQFSEWRRTLTGYIHSFGLTDSGYPYVLTDILAFQKLVMDGPPAVLETEEVFHFLQEALIFFASTYWYGFYIGGSTCIAADQTTYPPIDDSEYFDDDSGNIIFEWFIT